MSRTRKAMAGLLATLMLLATSVVAPAFGAPPGPGDKQCVPGQNNVGGGVGNSGPGDKQGAPLKPPPSCPGPNH